MKFKKLLVPVFGAMLALSLAACNDESTEDKDNNAKTEQTQDKEKKDKAAHEQVVTYIEPSEVLEKIENKETFAFILGDKECSACNSYKATTLTELKDTNGILLPFVELNGIENDDRKAHLNVLVQIIENHLDGQFEATPTTYFMVDGVMKDVTVGAISYEEFVKHYTENIGELPVKK